jgi:hypothetical protein
MSMEHRLNDKQTAFNFETLTVGASAIGPTVATIWPASGFEATYGLFTVETNTVRYRMDGTDPTASVGHPLYADQNLEVHGKENLRNLKFIQVSGGATVSCTYMR